MTNGSRGQLPGSPSCSPPARTILHEMFRLRVRSVDARSEGQPDSCPYDNGCRVGPIVDMVERGFQSGEGYQVLCVISGGEFEEIGRVREYG